MNKERLKEIMLDQREVFNSQTHLITRDVNLEKYIPRFRVALPKETGY